MSKRQSIEHLLEFYAPDKKVESGMLTHIGNKVGVTREYPRQIAKELGYVMPRVLSKIRKRRVCWVCGKVFINKRRNSLCSHKCERVHYEQKYWMIYECQECKFYYKHRKSYMKLRRQKHCSKTCQGYWLARKYGWSSRSFHKVLYKNTDNVRKDFTSTFTVKEFAIKYKYGTRNGAYNAIQDLVLKGVLVREGLHLYKVLPNEKAPIDFGSPGA